MDKLSLFINIEKLLEQGKKKPKPTEQKLLMKFTFAG